MSNFVFGILVGVIVTLFCVFCIDAAARDARISDSEIEAWKEHLKKEREDSGH